MKFKAMLAINLFYILGIFSLLTFQEYQVKMREMLSSYSKVGTQDMSSGKQRVSDILGDPVK